MSKREEGATAIVLMGDRDLAQHMRGFLRGQHALVPLLVKVERIPGPSGPQLTLKQHGPNPYQGDGAYLVVQQSDDKVIATLRDGKYCLLEGCALSEHAIYRLVHMPRAA